MPRALITGTTGQDGRYLAQLLVAKGYDVFGMVSGQANPKIQMVQEETPELEFIEGDLQDLSSLISVVELVQPDEVYNLGAISFVALSFRQPELTADITGLGVLRMLEAIRVIGGAQDNSIRFYQASSSEMFGKVRAPPAAIKSRVPKCRFYFSGSSEMFGNAHQSPQNEHTAFFPRSSYGISKLAGYHLTRNYREAYGLHASSGMLFNHESPRRGLEFVTRKITNGIARIKLGLQDKLVLGNLEASRDWGFAGDYVEAMWRMLQQDEPDDYVIATGETHTIREFLSLAFEAAGFDDWKPYVGSDPRFERPAEVDVLIGDATKAREKLGWAPKVDFPGLVRMMVEADIAAEEARDHH